MSRCISIQLNMYQTATNMPLLKTIFFNKMYKKHWKNKAYHMPRAWYAAFICRLGSADRIKAPPLDAGQSLTMPQHVTVLQHLQKTGPSDSDKVGQVKVH